MLRVVTVMVLSFCIGGLKGQSLNDEIITKAAGLGANVGSVLRSYYPSTQKNAAPGPMSSQQQPAIVVSRNPFSVTTTNHDSPVWRPSGLTGIGGNFGHMGRLTGTSQPVGNDSPTVMSGRTAPRYPYTNNVDDDYTAILSGRTAPRYPYTNNMDDDSPAIMSGGTSPRYTYTNNMDDYSPAIMSGGTSPRYPYTNNMDDDSPAMVSGGTSPRYPYTNNMDDDSTAMVSGGTSPRYPYTNNMDDDSPALVSGGTAPRYPHTNSMDDDSPAMVSGGIAPRYPYTNNIASLFMDMGPLSSMFGGRLNQRFPSAAHNTARAFAGDLDDAFEHEFELDDDMPISSGHRGAGSLQRPIYNTQSNFQMLDD